MCVFKWLHTWQHVVPCVFSGGNQRELARQKNAKKQAAVAKSKAAADKAGNKGAGLEQRKQRDADIMREKQKKAAEKKT